MLTAIKDDNLLIDIAMVSMVQSGFRFPEKCCVVGLPYTQHLAISRVQYL